jgi:hypothetical protein
MSQNKYREFLSSLPIKGNYKAGKIEKSFMSDFFSILRKQDWICYHIQDIGLSAKFLDGIIISPDGEVILLEFKKITGYTFNISQFEPSQLFLLNQLSSRKFSEAYVPIFSVKTNSYVLTTFDEIKSMRNDRGGAKLFAQRD